MKGLLRANSVVLRRLKVSTADKSQLTRTWPLDMEIIFSRVRTSTFNYDWGHLTHGCYNQNAGLHASQFFFLYSSLINCFSSMLSLTNN